MKQTAALPRMLFCLVGLFSYVAATAQQYDLYTYNVKTQEVKRITHLNGPSAFNASWSNNGKKLAHDLVGPSIPFGQSIYITDVETGNTSPLAGAEGGNDAAWSP